ncbi:MAG TPA: triple tyrosine motif-containing protein, partial [Candidatus Eremiobacteraceae bacterium]|nr:triple tyrosine motif-containing protein [Candidatus Eremiobacteraceae bacterium]
YRLENVDQAWSEPTAVREVDYTNVPPGRFTFHVQARNSDGAWNGQEAAMTFDIEPAFWQNRTYRLFGVAGVLLLGWSFYRLRLRQLTATADLRYSERLAERTRIARELHDTLLQSFQGLMLRLQLVDELLVLLGHKRTFWCRIVLWDHAYPRQAHKRNASRHIWRAWRMLRGTKTGRYL